MIREAIDKIVRGKDLTTEEAAQVMTEIMEGQATHAQIAAFVTALRIKGESAEEITGMATVMREKSLKVVTDGFLVDTCGTGGDGHNTMNVSTAAAIVAAAAGVKIAKHGNRAASSACGSADILEANGVKIDLSPEGVKRCIDEVGMGFMFAQVFHPAMRHAAVPRREIGIRTVFNILGPLTNPAGAHAQLLGVADPGLGEKMANALGKLGTQRAMVVHGMEGMDEISISGPTRIWELADGKVRTHTITPEEVGLPSAPLDSIKGGTLEHHKEMFLSVLNGVPGPAQDVVALNAAAALVLGGKARDLKDGIALAKKAIASGAARKKLADLASLSQKLS
ncbi:MAG: anthranilate phosphoribosyltransferase [Dehalococcoidia bacterium]|nr:anthranilate phosphoribosyltransferase [Dehalococcoidia bacterium]